MKRACLLLAVLCSSAWGHELHLQLTQQRAAVARLVYADGQPFAFEAYEIYAPEKDVPEQVGRTNARGEIAFVPGTQSEWRIKAHSADGHGVNQIIRVPLDPAGDAAPTANAEAPSRPLLWAAGLGVIFGLFGLAQLLIRRKP